MDARSNESLGAAFADSPLAQAQDARDMGEIAGLAIAGRFGSTNLNEVVGNVGGLTVTPFVAVQFVDSMTTVQEGDMSGWIDLTASVTTGALIMANAAMSGPRPVLTSSAIGTTVGLASNVSMVGGVTYFYVMGGTRLYYKNLDAASSQQAMNAVGANLLGMIKSYSDILTAAKNDGCL